MFVTINLQNNFFQPYLLDFTLNLTLFSFKKSNLSWIRSLEI